MTEVTQAFFIHLDAVTVQVILANEAASDVFDH
jgi:hypothetical protein